MVTPDKKNESNSAEVVRSFIATWNTHDTSAILALLILTLSFAAPCFRVPCEASRRARAKL